MILPKYCLDTHSLVWYLLKKKTLSPKAKNIIKSIFNNKSVGIVSVMVILEAYYVGLKDDKFDFIKFLKVIDRRNIKIISFDMEILNQSYVLPIGLDIHDRVIVATSVITGSKLISKDSKIRKLFPKETIW
jgi:PIN domain nuclease of toxin-antitoxin system